MNRRLAEALEDKHGQSSPAFSELVKVIREVARDEFEQLQWEADHPHAEGE